ncbi:hypothetical protein [Nitratifractor sp.]
MIRQFTVVMILLAALLASVFVHYLVSDCRGIEEAVARTVAVTGLASPALGVEWYEPRLRRFEPSQNVAYPELMPADRLSYVYGALYGK